MLDIKLQLHICCPEPGCWVPASFLDLEWPGLDLKDHLVSTTFLLLMGTWAPSRDSSFYCLRYFSERHGSNHSLHHALARQPSSATQGSARIPSYRQKSIQLLNYLVYSGVLIPLDSLCRSCSTGRVTARSHL